jgi:aminopeptidase N
VLLTGTKQDAFALLDNATVITYGTDFDITQRIELLILAHEISHKWWGYGSVHDESDWLNEAFATYSSMLYLQARGDTAGYRQNYEKLAKTTANTPAIIGFDRTKYEPGMYRRIVYNKGMVVLAALHARVGTEQLYAILARTAAQRVSTTTGFLDVVGQVAGTDTRTWLLARLSE